MKWVPTHLNPADLATREASPISEVSSMWLEGPEFLHHDEETWPVEISHEPDLYNDPEVKTVLLTTATGNVTLPDITRFSSYWRLVRTTAWILRFIANLRSPVRLSGELQAEETRSAELFLLKGCQKRTFSGEMHTLQTTSNVDKDSRLYKLVPFLDSDGLIRAHSRINSATVTSYDTKNPIILYPRDYFVKLLILQYHKDAAHIGKEKVLNDLRQRFWLLRGRSAVKAAWRECQTCKNKRAEPNPPIMGQIPESRLTAVRAFAYTGLDYFGPMTVKVGRRHEKRYGALFTCLTVRAIHIELVDDLTSDSAIMALRRFILRRGTPLELWSDNATTFKGADNELRRYVERLDQDRLRQFSSVRHVNWRNICPNSPHQGGCWERMVRSVKTALKSTLKDQTPTHQILLTVLTETEMFVNSRPLTDVSIDHDDDPPLTPYHFIFGGVTDFTTQTLATFNDTDLLRRSWRRSQRLADLVWKRWVKEYLPTLTKRGKWFRTVEPVKLDDVVIVCDDQLPRNVWPKGIVTECYPGRDGQVRVVDVKTTAGTYRRPVTKICRLDVRPSSD